MTESAEVIQVIKTTSSRGDGKNDPYRTVDQYWSFEGVLLAEHDVCSPSKTKEEALEFYAEPENYKRDPSNVDSDGGEKARTAIGGNRW